MRRALALAIVLAAGGTARAQDTLDIYLIDVEGGGATLFATPEGESILIDTGNGGAASSTP